MSLLGPAYALLTALSWAVAVILFRRTGEEISPAGLNTFKNAIGFGLLLATLPFSGGWEPMGLEHTVMLLVSGAVGIGVADTLFFFSLNILGASRQAIVDCAYSPIIVSLSFLLLGERLSPLDGFGALLIVGAMVIVVLKPAAESVERARVALGVVVGISAMFLMGIAIVWVKPILNDYGVVVATTVRMAGGMGVLGLLALFHRPSRRGVAAAFVPQPAWRWAIPGSVVGAYVSLLFWIAGFKYNDAGVAAIFNQTSTVFIVVLAAVFLKEPLTPRRLLAVAMAFGGSLLVIL